MSDGPPRADHDDAVEVRARTEALLDIRFPAPLEPIFSLYTAEEHQDPLVVWAPDSLDDSFAVSLLGMRGAGKTLEHALNRIDSIPISLGRWELTGRNDDVP